MWWSEMRQGVPVGVPRLIRLVAPFAAACLLAGCFQPLYGEHSVGAGPSIKAALGTVDVAQIPAPNGTPELFLTDPAGFPVQLQHAAYIGGGGIHGEIGVKPEQPKGPPPTEWRFLWEALRLCLLRPHRAKLR